MHMQSKGFNLDPEIIEAFTKLGFGNLVSVPEPTVVHPVPIAAAIHAKVLQESVERVCTAVREHIDENLSGLHHFHFVKDYKIKVHYGDQIAPKVEKELRRIFKEAGYRKVVFHPHEKGVSVIELFVGKF